MYPGHPADSAKSHLGSPCALRPVQRTCHHYLRALTCSALSNASKRLLLDSGMGPQRNKEMRRCLESAPSGASRILGMRSIVVNTFPMALEALVISAHYSSWFSPDKWLGETAGYSTFGPELSPHAHALRLTRDQCAHPEPDSVRPVC